MNADLAKLFQERYSPTLPITVVQTALANAAALVQAHAPETVSITAQRGINELSPAADTEEGSWTIPEGATLTENGRVLVMPTAMPITYKTAYAEDILTTAILKLAQQDLVYAGYLNASVGGLAGAVDMTNQILRNLREDTL